MKKIIKKNILSMILASTLLTACSFNENESEANHFNKVLEIEKDNVLLDEYIESKKDEEMITKIDIIESKIDKYFNSDNIESKKVKAYNSLKNNDIEEVSKLCEYVLISSLCNELGLDINKKHVYKFTYDIDKKTYTLAFDGNIYDVRKDDNYYHLGRYMAIFDTYMLLGKNKAVVLNDSLQVCKNILSQYTIIENGEIYTKEKENTKKLTK